MQLFQLDLDIETSVQSYYDIHINKTIVELTQCIASACIRQGVAPPNKMNGEPYKPSYADNHPLVDWILESKNNLQTVLSYIAKLNSEYKFRFAKEKDHSCLDSLIDWIQRCNYIQLFYSIKKLRTTPQLYPGCPPYNGHASQDITDEQIIEGYRQYYMREKVHLRRYTGRQIPEWMVINAD